jgi:nucleotide-binding universal stress UspA family protein
MVRSVMVPLDGSSFGEHALPLALTIARRAQAKLEVVHVHSPVVFLDATMGYEAGVDEHIRGQEKAYLDRVVERLSFVATVPVTSALLDGPVADMLHEHAQATKANLIVMTTHGRGPVSRLWLGSVADELIRRTPTPLLLERPHEGTPDLTRERLLRHILIPLDGSELAERVLEPALALGAPMEADYTLLRVTRAMLPLYPEAFTTTVVEPGHAMLEQLQQLHEQVRGEALAYLDRVAERVRARGSRVRTHVASGEQPAAIILDVASATGSDLIALQTHGRRGMSRLLLGSVADKVLRGAGTPVLVSRAAGK